MLSFGKDVVAAKSQDVAKSNERVIDAVLALRGFGTTDVAAALTAAADQLSRSRAGRKITILLSDCRATAPGDVVGAALRLDELVIVAPESDDVEARELAAPCRRPHHDGVRPLRRCRRPRPRPRHVTDHDWGQTPIVIGRCRLVSRDVRVGDDAEGVLVGDDARQRLGSRVVVGAGDGSTTDGVVAFGSSGTVAVSST